MLTEDQVGIAIDVGTSAVKAAAYDRNGAFLAAAHADAPVRRPAPGFSEYDTAEVWASICTAVAGLRAQGVGQVVRVSCTGQGDGCWLLDAEGRPVGPAILWNDGRGNDIVDRWTSADLTDRAYQITGSAHFAGSQGAILQWLREHEPARLAQARHALFSTGWLTHRLCGEAVMDRSDASLPWLEAGTTRLSQELLRSHDLEWTARLRPRLLDGHPVVGHLTLAAASDLGLTQGIPVVHGPFDCVAMALGAAVMEPGDTLLILGTTLIVEGVTDSPAPRGAAAGMTLATALEDRWLRLMGTLSGTDSINWAAQLTGCATAQDYVDLAGRSPAGARGVHVLPYFSPAGERAPLVDPTARGSVVGLTLDHDRTDLARAHLEGLAYAVRDCVEAMNEPPSTLVVCGGASASALVCQVLADVLGTPVEAMGGLELGTLGADVAARAAVGGVDVRRLARESRPPTVGYHPDAGTHAFYDREYDLFHELRTQAQPAWATLAEVAQSQPVRG